MTTQNMMGHYAGFASRLIAFIVDLLILVIVQISTVWFISVTLSIFQLNRVIGLSVENLTEKYSWAAFLAGGAIYGLFFLFLWILYFTVMWGATGQTFGKALVGLRVVPLNGKRLSYWKAFVRVLAYYVSALPLFLGFIWILFDSRRLGFHDKIARTCVIYTWPARPDENFLAIAMSRLHLIQRAQLDKTEKTPTQPPKPSG
jgi:uncharacterized RDD family membrane protein YckC